MADKIKAIKIKQKNGTYSEEVPISVNVQNVQWDENNHTLLDALGSVDISSSGKGNLQHQIDELDGDKISTNQFNSRLNDFLREQISADTTDWLDDNVNPVGSAVIVDKTLTIEGAAADAKVIGDELAPVKAGLGSLMEPKRLAAGTDLNTITTPGTYTLHTSMSYVNKPTENSEHGILEVWHEDFRTNQGRTFQRLTYTYKAGRTQTEIWTRSKAAASEATWTPWVSIVNVDELNKNSLLINEVIPNTIQSYIFTDGRISQIVHSRNSSAIRTDSFTYGTGTITEVRTLTSGGSLTIVTNLSTLETTITYTEV